jgi:hypothetical protein
LKQLEMKGARANVTNQKWNGQSPKQGGSGNFQSPKQGGGGNFQSPKQGGSGNFQSPKQGGGGNFHAPKQGGSGNFQSDKQRSGYQPRDDNTAKKGPFLMEYETEDECSFRIENINETLFFGAFTAERNSVPVGLQVGEDGKIAGIDNPLDYKGKEKYFFVVNKGGVSAFEKHWDKVWYAKNANDAGGGENLIQPAPCEWNNKFASYSDFLKWIVRGANIVECIDYANAVAATAMIRTEMQKIFFNTVEDVLESLKRIYATPFKELVERYEKYLATKTTYEKELVECLLQNVQQSHIFNPKRTPFENAIIIMNIDSYTMAEDYKDAQLEIIDAIKTVCFVISRPLMVVINTASPEEADQNVFFDENTIVGIWIRPAIINSREASLPPELMVKPTFTPKLP